MAGSTKLQLAKVIDSVAKKVSPTKQEAQAERAFAQMLMEKLSDALPMAKVIFVGSAARDTGLRGSRDIDLFVSFERSLSEDEIVDLTFFATKKAIPAKWEKHYAEHPYLQSNIKGYDVEVIPCFSMSKTEKIKSAVDRSPLHMAYLSEKLTQNQRRDVRVLKQLMKNSGIYGAEAKIGGFSGYVCELLVLNYRSLPELLFEASKWRIPVAIDIEGSYFQDEKRIAADFPQSPMIVIDVTDKSRNAAAAISIDCLAKFVALSRRVIAKPSESIFFSKPKAASRAQVSPLMAKRKTHFLLVKAKSPELVEDILYPQLKKTSDVIAAHLRKEGFSLVDSMFFTDASNSFLLFEFAYPKASPVKIRAGPPVFDAEAVKRFLSIKRKGVLRGPFVREGKILFEEVQDYAPKACLQNVLSDPARFGVASYFVKPMKNAKTFENKGIVAALGNPEALSEFSRYLFRKDEFA